MPDDYSRTLALLERLVAFDTESTKSNLPLIEAVEAHCRALGVPVHLAPNPDGSKAALFLTIGPQVDGGVLLSGHTDCVPVTGQSWSSDPFQLREDNGRLYGRGTCDMKGFDAIALAMIPAFQAADLRRPIHILLSYDEELTCLGPMDIIARFGVDLPRPGIAIVGEPTSLQVADSHKSVCTYRTTVHGVEAHSAKPQLGANAIAGACDLVVGLDRIGRQLESEPDRTGRFDPPYSTVHCGRIEGGTARNILARRCELSWEYRGLPQAELDVARRAFDTYAEQEVLPRLNRFNPGGRIETVTEVEVPGLRPEPGSAAEALALRVARSNATIAVAFATEAGRFQAAGIPTVVCGPGSIDQAHQPDEYIAVSELQSGIAFMHRLIDACR
ncbi:acetylornithine deacetylase [Lichenihabitans sp. Uapishka_5]|uniref:acetylornithine deacetylase n=1 Tax=Lichenihabitans sp. Uapishka_5 TaxID=3037302 RepID=UPI0029E822A9|nr:acetylornithine deacetylase [Lichenihabitans sp. Uapishka_5]MDX7952735.1 acetylornithine deacetylase [Lichenihabitans sp. Uapishka_5]